eukprot:Clim_evm6s85 gene=Clim_evmTU6s85
MDEYERMAAEAEAFLNAQEMVKTGMESSSTGKENADCNQMEMPDNFSDLEDIPSVADDIDDEEFEALLDAENAKNPPPSAPNQVNVAGVDTDEDESDIDPPTSSGRVYQFRPTNQDSIEVFAEFNFTRRFVTYRNHLSRKQVRRGVAITASLEDQSSYLRSLSRNGLLLDKSIDDLRAENDERRRQEQLLASVSMAERQAVDFVDPESGLREHKLWVDKYSPKTFAQLISDDSLNLRLLGWLKAWNYCCFGELTGIHAQTMISDGTKVQKGEVTFIPNEGTIALERMRANVEAAAERRALQHAAGVGPKKVLLNKGLTGQKRSNVNSDSSTLFSQHDKGQNRNSLKAKLEREKPIMERNDSMRRPQHRIIMIAGPPGLGKTTVAHIVARHCGYEPVEMNASDDRQYSVFSEKVYSAVQMRHVKGSSQNPRPNCLIIDEIDGADRAAIGYLTRLLDKDRIWTNVNSRRDRGDSKGSSSSKWRLEDKEKEKSKKAKFAGMGLLRPIICICNNLYVPHLKQLREQALVLNIAKVNEVALYHRLNDICQLEGLSVDRKTMTALMRRLDHDMRSCLHTLQFFRQRKTLLSQKDLASLPSKDSSEHQFKVWDHIFKRQPDRNNAACKGKRRMQDTDDVPRPLDATHRAKSGRKSKTSSVGINLASTLEAIYANGDYERLRDGCFENYLAMPVVNANLKYLPEIGEWNTWCDILMNKKYTDGVQGMDRYVPYALAAYHVQCSAKHVPRLKFPNEGFQFHQRRQMLRDVMMGLHPKEQISKRNARDSNLQSVQSSGKVSLAPHEDNPADAVDPGDVQSLRSLWGSFGRHAMGNAVTQSLSDIYDIITPAIRGISAQMMPRYERKMIQQAANVMLDHGISMVQRKVSNHNGIKDSSKNTSSATTANGDEYEWVLVPEIDRMLSYADNPADAMRAVHGLDATQRLTWKEREARRQALLRGEDPDAAAAAKLALVRDRKPRSGISKTILASKCHELRIQRKEARRKELQQELERRHKQRGGALVNMMKKRADGDQHQGEEQDVDAGMETDASTNVLETPRNGRATVTSLSQLMSQSSGHSRASQGISLAQAKKKKVSADSITVVRRDFFGRIIESDAGGEKRRKTGKEHFLATHPLWYKYNEGVTNAVRRNIKLQDLL